MDDRHKAQYTIRGVTNRVDKVLRERAAKYGTSLNEEALHALERGLGLGNEQVRYHDMDDLVGTWVEDPEFDAVIKSMDQIDPEMWK